MSSSHSHLSCFLVALVALLGSGCSGVGSDPTAELQTVDCARPITGAKATYHGVRDRSACVWKGVEFGAPPVGELRFQFATPSTRTGDVDASTFGNTCMQAAGGHIESFRTRLTFGEDCLNLNIWSPGRSADGKPGEALPVMVWIYGGGFSSGSGNSELYSGEQFTTHDVIMVTLNYRLGALGWLAVTDATDSNQRRLAGNYGLSDQILALEWLRDNIAAFGGNPDNVTIFGESAGGYSVCALLASHKAKGLFKQAIMESGACMDAGPRTHQAESAKWIGDVGCPATAPESLACLRDLNADDLSENAAWPLFGFDAPVIDGQFLLDQPLATLRTDGRQVPLLAGFNADEVKLLGLRNFELLGKKSTQWSGVWPGIEAALGAAGTEAFRAAYDQAGYATPYDMLVEVANDLLFTCPAHAAVKTPAAPAWLYRFRIEPESFFLEPYSGSFHASEIPFVFGNFNLLMILYSDAEKLERAKTLSRQIMDYWTNFAKTGDPNGAGLPQWPKHGEGNAMMELTTPLSVSHGLFEERCRLWQGTAPLEINELFYEFVPGVLGVESAF